MTPTVQWITIAQAAKMLGMTRQSTWALVGKHIRGRQCECGNTWMVREDDVLAYKTKKDGGTPPTD